MTSALLVIDFINDIVHPKGKITRCAERIIKNKVITRANQAIAHARKKSWPIIFVKVGFHTGYLECPKHSPLFGLAPAHEALLLNSWGTEFHEDLDIKPMDMKMIKHRVSCFYATPLEAILHAQAINTLLLIGVATNMTIEHTARDAHDRDYAVIVIQDACETASKEAHEAALENLGRIAQVIDTEALIHE